MSVSENCSCGARIDFMPGIPVATALKALDRWRTDHRHDGIRPVDKNPLGFDLGSVMAQQFSVEDDNE